MITKHFILISLGIASVMVVSSCSKKVVQPVVEINAPVSNTTPNARNGQTNNEKNNDLSPYYQADWSSLKCGGNAHIVAGSNNLSTSMQMRMQRGKCIYVSLRPIMGIEAAKMVISDDSILLVDKLHKRYMLEKISLITNGVPVTVENLQDIFLGRAFELGKGTLTYSLKDDFILDQQSDAKVLVKPKSQYKGFDYNFVYDKQNNILSLDVTPTKSGSSTYSVIYGDVKGTVAGKVANSVNVTSKMGGKAFLLEMEYRDMSWNEVFTIDTKAPKKYTRIKGGDIMKMLGGGK